MEGFEDVRRFQNRGIVVCWWSHVVTVCHCPVPAVACQDSPPADGIGTSPSEVRSTDLARLTAPCFEGLTLLYMREGKHAEVFPIPPTFQSFREIYQLKQKYCQIVSVRMFLSINWSRSIHPERLVSQNWSVLLVQFFMASQQCDNVRGLVPKLAALRKMQAPRWVELGLREGLWSWDLHKHTLHENRRHQSLGSGFHWSSWAVSISYQGWDKQSPIFAEDMSSGSVWKWPGHPGPHLDLAFLLPWLDQNFNLMCMWHHIAHCFRIDFQWFPIQLQITPADAWNILELCWLCRIRKRHSKEVAENLTFCGRGASWRPSLSNSDWALDL